VSRYIAQAGVQKAVWKVQTQWQKLSMTGNKAEMVGRAVADADCYVGATVRHEVESFGMESRLILLEPLLHV